MWKNWWSLVSLQEDVHKQHGILECLIDIYAKCGRLNRGLQVLNRMFTHIRGIRNKSPQQLEVTWQWVQSLPYEGHSQKCPNVTLIPAQGSIFDYHDWRTCAISTSKGIGNCNMMAWARLYHLCGLAKTNVPMKQY